MRAARGRQSKASIQALDTFSVYLTLAREVRVCGCVGGGVMVVSGRR